LANTEKIHLRPSVKQNLTAMVLKKMFSVGGAAGRGKEPGNFAQTSCLGNCLGHEIIQWFILEAFPLDEEDMGLRQTSDIINIGVQNSV
jgi:hypothetical protein